MAVPIMQTGFSGGEISPSLYGQVNLDKERMGCTTARNAIVNYQGGIMSRPGTKFIGQAGGTASTPPRLITFQYSATQGYVLEVGDGYMRFIENGSYITETPIPVTNAASSGSDSVLSFNQYYQVASLTSINTNVVSSYTPGDTLTLAGGTAFSACVATVATTNVISIQLASGGTGYSVGQTFFLAGGIYVSGLTAIQVTSVGTGGVITGISLTGSADYTTNPTTLVQLGGPTGWSGTPATFNTIIMGVGTVTLTNPGTYSSTPGSTVSVATSSGFGYGVQFNATYNNNAVPFNNGDWVYVSGVVGMPRFNGVTAIVSGATSSGITLKTTQSYGASGINSSTWGTYVSGGTISRVYTIASPWTAADLALLKFDQSADVMTIVHPNYPPYDLTRFSNTNWALRRTTFAPAISTPQQPVLNATGTGTAWYYTYCVTAISDSGEESEASPPATVGLANLMSATAGSTVSISWPNVSGAASYNLYRMEPTSGSSVHTPVGAPYGFVASCPGTSYTEINVTPDFTQGPPTYNNPFAPGQVAYIPVISGGKGLQPNGTNTITVPSGTGVGFVGYPVISQAGNLVSIYVVNGGSLYSGNDVPVFNAYGYTPTTAPVLGKLTVTPGGTTTAGNTLTNPGVVAYFQQRRVYAGTNEQPDTYFMSKTGSYTNFDTSMPSSANDAIIGTPWAQQVNGIQAMMNMPTGLVIFTGLGAWLVSGGSQNAAITPSNQFATAQGRIGCNPYIKPVIINTNILYVQSKGCVVRDLTYNFFTNMYTGEDRTILSNHLFNGYTLSQMAWCEVPYKMLMCVRNDGAMLVMTYLIEQKVFGWTKLDTNGSFLSVTAVSEPPVDAAYVVVQRLLQDDGSPTIVNYVERFDNRQWDDEENVWCVDCGLSYTKTYPSAALNIYNNLYGAVGSNNITSALITIPGSGYTSPTITAYDSTGAGSGATFTAVVSGGSIVGVDVTAIGSNYTPGSTTLIVTDPTGNGAVIYPQITNIVTAVSSAASFSLLKLGTSTTTLSPYPNYTNGPITLTTQTGLGIIVGQQLSICAGDGNPLSYMLGTVTAYNSTTGSLSINITSFGQPSNGSSWIVLDAQILRCGGGVGQVVNLVSSSSGTKVFVNMTTPISSITPNDPLNTPQTFSNLSSVYGSGGAWSLAIPVTQVYGLSHLEGMTVSILADGGVVAQQVVSNGGITLPMAASSITIGLPFTVQIQTPYLDSSGGPTVQGRRKDIDHVTVRVNQSRGFTVGVNQVDAATVPFQYPQTWTNMQEPKQRTPQVYLGQAIPLQTTDYWLNVQASAGTSDWDTRGQVAIQQTNPLPLDITAVISWVEVGDDPG